MQVIEYLIFSFSIIIKIYAKYGFFLLVFFFLQKKVTKNSQKNLKGEIKLLIAFQLNKIYYLEKTIDCFQINSSK